MTGSGRDGRLPVPSDRGGETGHKQQSSQRRTGKRLFMAWPLWGRHGEGGFPFLSGLCHTLLAGREFRLRDKNARSPEGHWEKGVGWAVSDRAGGEVERWR